MYAPHLPAIEPWQHRRQRKQLMHLTDELERRRDPRFAVVSMQDGDTLTVAWRRGRAMVTGHRRNQRPPQAGAAAARQVKTVTGGIEKAQPPGPMVVSSQLGRVVIEAIGVMVWRLCLKFLRELADIVQTKQEANHAFKFFSRQPQQARQTAA